MFDGVADGFVRLAGLAAFSVGSCLTSLAGLVGLAFNSASTHDNCVALPADALAVNIVAVVAGLGCGLVTPITPCGGLAVGCASFAGLVAFSGVSGLTSLTGFVDLAFNSVSTCDNCAALPAAALAVDVVN